MTAVQPEGRYGALNISDNGNVNKLWRNQGDGSWINGGYFVCEPEVLKTISGDTTVFEEEPLTTMADNGELFCIQTPWFLGLHGYFARQDKPLRFMGQRCRTLENMVDK